MEDYNCEAEVARLKLENSSLHEEVAQLQADKEFVWSLWKRLQVASPDLTQAIGEVVRREKEKAEIKDRKVLQILQVKDSRIEQLEKLLIERNAEIKTLIEGKVCLDERITRLQIENQEYSDRLHFQDDQLRSRDNKDKTVTYLHKQMMEAFEKDKVDLQKNLSEQNSVNNILKAQIADLNAVKSVQETKISSLQQELMELRGQYDKILFDFEDAKRKVYKHDVDVRQLELQLEYKDTEMGNLKKELDEVWTTHQQCKNHAAEQASVINQLQVLQQDTQKMLQTQSDSYQIELQSLNAMYRDSSDKLLELKNLEGEHLSEIENLKQVVTMKDERIQELTTGVRERTVKLQTEMGEVEDFGNQVSASILEKDYKVHSLETERDMLKERLREKNRALKNLQKDNIVDLDLDLTPVKLTATQKVYGKDAQIQIKYENLEKRYRNTQQLLKLKSKEVDELRAAHTKRLERLKNVQSNYELVKNQLEALEEEYYGPRDDHKPKRCDAKALRMGDSDKVWNELNYFKQENKALMAERLQLQEEIDICKVQNVQAKAEIHELKILSTQAREEMQNAIEDRDRLLEPDENVALQLKSTKYELFGKESALESVMKEKVELSRKCEILESERRKIRQELNETVREVAEKRIQVCDLKEQLRKSQKFCRKLKRGRVVRPRKGVSFNKDADTDSAQNEVDWEEVDEHELQPSGTETDGTLISTSEDLAVPAVPTARQIESIEHHIERQRKVEKQFVPKRVPRRRRIHCSRESVVMRDRATSPHKFNDRVRRTFNNGVKNQLRNAMTRLMNTQEQLKTVRRDKIIAEKTLEEQRSTIDNLQKDLLSANQRLRTIRANHQRLLTENENLLAEKTVLEKKAANVAAFLDEKTPLGSPRESSDDKKILESRLKISAAECSKQLALIKTLRTDVEEKNLKISELADKVSRLERDTAQKRLLLEDTRLRLRLSQEQLQANQATIEELNCQVTSSNLTLERQKVNVESAKNRVQASLKEKREYERLYRLTVEKHEDTKLELEKTGSALSQMKVRLANKEREVNEIEDAAHEQMKHTVQKSEAAIELIQKKIQQYQQRLNVHKRFVEGLCQRILRSTENARSVVKGRLNEKLHEDLTPDALKRASDVAKNILNIDQDELDDIMGCEKSDLSELSTADQGWRDNCQKLVNEKGDFSVTLADLIMERVEEQFRLLSGLDASR